MRRGMGNGSARERESESLRGRKSGARGTTEAGLPLSLLRHPCTSSTGTPPQTLLYYIHMDPEVGRKLILIGGGGHALVVAEALQAAGVPASGFYGANAEAGLGPRLDVPYLGPMSAIKIEETDLYILAVGDVGLRRKVAQQLPYDQAATII